jgi:hypothetical protein
MRFWLREVIGWILVLLGLAVFYLCYELLMIHHLVEAGALTVIGFIIFRGGIHLLKVAVAAQVCKEAQDKVSASRQEEGGSVPVGTTSRKPTWMARLPGKK